MPLLGVFLSVVAFSFSLFALVPRNLSFDPAKSTQKRLDLLKKYFIEAYDLSGSLPEELPSELRRDGWGRFISAFDASSFGGREAVKAFVSSGPNGRLESSVSSQGELAVGGDDLFAVLLKEDLSRTLRSKTLRSIEEAQNALSACAPMDVQQCYEYCHERYRGRDLALCLEWCRTQGSEPICQQSGCSCVVQLVQRRCLLPSKGYDGWGKILWFDASSQKFYSCGPDRTCGTEDDFTN